MTGTLVLLSGGMDSTVLLAHTLHTHPDEPVHTLTVDYGQRHHRETVAARQVADHYDVPYRIADLTALAPLLRSALTGHAPIPEGHYAEATMGATVVPNRNAILLNVAAGIAAGHGLARVVTAVHAGDHPVYPDCRPEFIAAADTASRLGCGVTIDAPFVGIDKASICALGHDLHAPLHLTWSCYQGGEDHCGRCGTCVERAEAFHLANVPDPTRYLDTTYWTTVTHA